MKTTINWAGRLTIEAETEMEQFALKKWWDEYRPAQICPSTLCVVFDGTLPKFPENGAGWPVSESAK